MLQGFACCLSPGPQLALLNHTVWNPYLGQTLPLSLLPAEEPDLYCSATVWLLIRLKLQTTKQAAGKRIFLSGLQELKTRLCVHSFPIHRAIPASHLSPLKRVGHLQKTAPIPPPLCIRMLYLSPESLLPKRKHRDSTGGRKEAVRMTLR